VRRSLQSRTIKPAQAATAAGRGIDRMAAANASVVSPRRRDYDLAALVARITPKNRHAAVDWGRPVGHEVW